MGWYLFQIAVAVAAGWPNYDPNTHGPAPMIAGLVTAWGATVVLTRLIDAWRYR